MSPAERHILQVRLDGARQAYHDLMTGASLRVLVDQNGERAEFNQASSARLAAYIAELERKLGIGAAPGPLRFFK